jgi:hypothetical protein
MFGGLMQMLYCLPQYSKWTLDHGTGIV